MPAASRAQPAAVRPGPPPPARAGPSARAGFTATGPSPAARALPPPARAISVRPGSPPPPFLLQIVPFRYFLLQKVPG